MKTCSSCKEEKELNEFHRKGKYYHSLCKLCRKSYIKAHYEKNKEAYKASSAAWKSNNSWRVLGTRYNMNPDVIEKIMSIGQCEICGSSENLVFDHVHETNEPRGCLCTGCNVLLGRLGDTNDQIKSKISLIEKYLSK